VPAERAVRAAVWREPGRPGSVEDVTLAPPGAGEVLVRIAAAGVCHSDLHLADGHLGGRFPIVLGHEGAGIVEEAGSGVHHVAPGDPVAFCFVPSCGECASCRAGKGNLCPAADESSFRDCLPGGGKPFREAGGEPLRQFLAIGCFAERCVVPAACAVPVPRALPLWQAALVGCAVVTGMGAVRNAARVREGEAVCVVGCGGVGLQVLAGAQLAGADPIVALDRVPEKLERARARGATHVVDASRPDAAAQVRRLTGGGVQHAFEVVGRTETIRLAWDCLRPGGTAVVVGLAAQGVDAVVPAIEFLSEKTLRGCFYGSGNPAREVAELAVLLAEERLSVADTVSHVTGLDGIEEAFARLRRGEGARTVVLLDPELAGR
jgi:S-(hydroxymethyl)glutathione dehydrogenase/alcohol dehydrogenase